jgi:hypothetical protein
VNCRDKPFNLNKNCAASLHHCSSVNQSHRLKKIVTAGARSAESGL